VPHLSHAEQRVVLREALAAAMDAYPHHRGDALASLAPHIASVSREFSMSIWNETLQNAATCNRKLLLSDLTALLPVLVALGGPAAVQETARAILDVGDWWP
jgi:hypothetical protein